MLYFECSASTVPALSGSALSVVDGASDDSGQANHGFLYREESTGLIPGGTSKTTLEYTSGWRGKGDANGDADGDADIVFSLATDGSPNASNDGLGTVDGTSKSNGDDLIYLSYNVHNISLHGNPQDPFGDYSSEIIDNSIVFRSQNDGTTDGTGDGDADEDSTSASIDSEVKGKGNSLLVMQSFRNYDIGSNPGMDPDLRHLSVQNNRNEHAIIKGKFSIDGDLTGSRNDGGPIGWSIDSTMSDDLDAKYKSNQSFRGLEVISWRDRHRQLYLRPHSKV